MQFLYRVRVYISTTLITQLLYYVRKFQLVFQNGEASSTARTWNFQNTMGIPMLFWKFQARAVDDASPL